MTSDGEVVLLGLKRPPGAKTELGRLKIVIKSSRCCCSILFSELVVDPTIVAPVRIASPGREALVDGDGAPETECLMLLVGGTVSI